MRERGAVWISGALIALCVAILFADYAIASRRRPTDDQRIVTAARLSRKSRDNAIAWLLISASAVFLTAARRGADTRVCRVETRLDASSPHTHKTRHECRAGRLRARATSAVAIPLDLTFIDQLVAREGRGRESAIILLQAIQNHYRYLPQEALRRIVELTEITPAGVAGTSTFYGQFRHSPVGKHVVRVCHGTACHVSGARQITEELRRSLAIPEGADTDPQRQFTVDEVACLGCCSLAPVMTIDGHTCGRLTPSTACNALP